jgi:LysR family transcriptional regulator, hydrogen peroxide-inducible genes activator
MKSINIHLSLRALGYLVALAETGHFGKAAERCFVSQPTLSAQLKKMEDQLGVQLVERGQQVRLTAIGERIVERARRVLDEAREIEELARNFQDPLAGELRIGLIPTVGPYLLPRIAGALRERFPRLKLLLLEHQTNRLVELLKSGEIDVGILALPIPVERLVTRVLYPETFQVALPTDHRLARRRRLTLDDLDGETLLLLEDGHCLRDQAIDVCATVGANPEHAIQGTSLTTLCQMVSAGSGVTLLPASAREVEARAGSGLVTRPLRDPRPNRVVVLAWRASSPLAPLYRAFAEAIAPAVQEQCPLDQPAEGELAGGD